MKFGPTKGPPLRNTNVYAPAGLGQDWRSAGNSDLTAIRLYTRLKDNRLYTGYKVVFMTFLITFIFQKISFGPPAGSPALLLL